MVCNHVHGIPAVNQMLQRNEKKCGTPLFVVSPPQLARVHISRIASGASISWECPPCRVPSVARKSLPVETLAGPQGPPRGYKLHCSPVLAATIKVFNGIPLQLLRIPTFLAFSITVWLSLLLEKKFDVSDGNTIESKFRIWNLFTLSLSFF